jgi:hypothetical protein
LEFVLSINPDKITDAVAERVLDRMSGREDQGDIDIDGEKVWWWSDRASVWFYASDDSDGEDTIKRFDVHSHVSVRAS